ATDLSAFYMNVVKDRLYADQPDSPERRSTQTALHAICSALCRMLAPVLSHTAEEAWQLLPGATGAYPSVELAPFPVVDAAHTNPALSVQWDGFFAVRDRVNKALEEAKANGIKKALEARVTLIGAFPALNGFTNDELTMLFNVSDTRREAETGNVERIEIGGAVGSKCPRCWLVKRDIGRDPLFRDICVRCAEAVRALE
ncbi:MAG: class I tRNA ligase family protein, partial [Armatimonadetes bacterium]|nr:class I tRNA ligase family protein [Armatimonadota bacterium]